MSCSETCKKSCFGGLGFGWVATCTTCKWDLCSDRILELLQSENTVGNSSVQM